MPRALPVATVALALLGVLGCRPQITTTQLSPEPQLNALLLELQQALEAHAWERVLALADPEHYRVQVTDHGMPEPQYVAELLGLHDVNNSIAGGQGITWSDLERIRTVRYDSLVPEQDRHTLMGEVELDDGETLRLRAWITRHDRRYRLTGGFG